MAFDNSLGSARRLLVPLCIFFSWFVQTSSALTLRNIAARQDDVDTITLQNSFDVNFLRICPLGASITWGVGSSPEDGYRKPLRDQLRSTDWEVDMVGSRRNFNGEMADNDVEAVSGYWVNDVRLISKSSYRYKPNIVLINAGSNDANNNGDIPSIGERMKRLINEFLDADGMQNTTMILSTLTPMTSSGEAHRGSVNAQYRQLVQDLQLEQRAVVLADMDPMDPNNQYYGYFKHPDDFADSVHPNNRGHAKMAQIWFRAILEARNLGYLKEALPLEDTMCEKQYGDGVYAGGLTQTGSGEHDGIYRHASEEKGVLLTIWSDWDRNQWRFAKLFTNARDDLVGWFEKADGNVAYGCWKNTGNENPRFVKIDDMSVKDNCIPRGVHFVDVNGDGLDDFVCISPSGEAFASINEGNGDHAAGKPPTFRYIGSIKSAVSGYDQSRVRLGDVDGDGRVDYCVCDANGDIQCWRNGWIDDKPKYWQHLGKRFTGKGMGDLRGVRFEDVNGDGRDDWIWVDDDGKTFTWTNSRSCMKGREGDGLNVVWRQGFNGNSNSGPTHFGMGDFASSGLRNRIHFARIYGESQAFGLPGRHDYVFMEHTEVDGRHRFDVRVWKNKGMGGSKIKSDGNRYCNMMGHDNGMMDYVWIWSTGAMRIYPNRGLGMLTPNSGSFWGPSAEIWTPPRNMDRRDLHLADWDGDGLCDIIYVNPDENNKVTVFRNKYRDNGGRWGFEDLGRPDPNLQCNERRGVGIYDLAVRFADVSGSGVADYLCIEKDGRVSGWTRNEKLESTYIDQFKFAQGFDRANLRWADVNGDGRADMIWVNKFNGDGQVFYNEGREDIGGSRYHWRDAGMRFQGSQAGLCMHYPDLNGDRRADMHGITHSLDNTAETWFNECSGGDGGGGDDPDTPKGNTRVEVGDEKLTYGTTPLWEALEKLKSHCSNVGCSPNNKLQVDTQLINAGNFLDDYYITISATGSFNSGGLSTRDHLVDLAVAVSKNGFEKVRTKYTDNCGDPFCGTKETDVYHYTSTIDVATTADDGADAFLNLFMTIEGNKGLDMCGPIVTAASGVAASISGVAGGVFVLASLLCRD